ncbi:MAG: hypothetical protein LAN83_07315 [Acidobacteriia bacterium]|nr:hypothetical protein [Terriglobia bacterium]
MDEDIPLRPVGTPQARKIAAKGIQEPDGPTPADIALEAICILAREDRTPTNKAALHLAIIHYRERFSLDF